MAEIKISDLLSVLIDDTKKIVNKGFYLLTAKRFLVAIVDKMNISIGDIAGPKMGFELLVLSDTVKESIPDKQGAKTHLMTYITDEKKMVLADGVYMEKIVEELMSKNHLNAAEINRVLSIGKSKITE